MRTKKQIRRGQKMRPIIGFALMTLGVLMMIGGYIVLVYDGAFLDNLKSGGLNVALLTIIIVAWFVSAIVMFFGGFLVKINWSVKHHDYEERPHSSRV